MIDSSDECFLATHYQVDRYWFIRSKKGYTFEKMMKKKKNIKAIFTGHFHPKETVIIHHGKKGGVEYCGSSPFNHNMQGLVTIDNERLIYHNILIKKKNDRPLFFMTHPIPNEQLSSQQIFNELNTEIRVISFDENDIELTVSGDINGIMKFKTNLDCGAKLYTYPLNLKKYGNYKIFVTGKGCFLYRSFFIGKKYKGNYELAIRYIRGFIFMRFSIIPLFLCLLTIIIPGMDFKYAEIIENYIEGKNENYNNLKSKMIIWFGIILFGPFVIRHRFLKLKKIIRLTFFIFLIYPLIFPQFFFSNIYKFGFSSSFFIFYNKKFEYQEWALQMTYIYYGCIITPDVIFASGEKFYSLKKIMKYVNILPVILLNIIAVIINIRYVGECVKWQNLIYTPIYSIIPFIIKLVIFNNIEFCNKKTHRNMNRFDFKIKIRKPIYISFEENSDSKISDNNTKNLKL